MKRSSTHGGARHEVELVTRWSLALGARRKEGEELGMRWELGMWDAREQVGSSAAAMSHVALSLAHLGHLSKWVKFDLPLA
ncbi:hypothetical protein Droror1_Dr00019353 [Drosera rotundifolia]